MADFKRGLIVGIILALFSWTVYQLFNQGLNDVLGLFGIENFYLQTLIIILFLFILLIFMFKKTIKKILLWGR